MIKKYILMAALLPAAICAKAQTTVNFESEDYKAIGTYDMWTESPFRTGILAGNAAVADNPDKNVDPILGVAPNPSDKVVALQRSRFASNAYGVRIDLKEPFRMTKQLQYIHVMAYLKDKPTESRMMVIGLGKHVDESWSWQTGEDEQFWALTNAPVKPQAGWQDIVVPFKGFSYSKEENPNSGIEIHSLVIVPDVRSPHADEADWAAYFDNIVVDSNSDKRFSTAKYAINFAEDAVISRNDRLLNGVGLRIGDQEQKTTFEDKLAYHNVMSTTVFAAQAGQEVKPVFDYTGAWMSAYVYADWGKDAKFTYNVNDNGTPAEGSDVVSYNAAQLTDKGPWYKSDGTTRADGNSIAEGVPTFTIPETTAPGFYRMRYKVDWNSLDPAGADKTITDGGGIVDVTLDVYNPGQKVKMSSGQLNGDIFFEDAQDSYETEYGRPVKIKIVPAPGFVQNGFTLKYGYDVASSEQLDDNGNPNWIQITVPATDIAADNTFTIPAQYVRGNAVRIQGDMQSVNHYPVKVVGAPEGQGGVTYCGKEYKDGETIDASQYFSSDEVQAIAIENYDVTVQLDAKTKVITVTYKQLLPLTPITSLNQLRNDRAYQIKAVTGEGYYAWNTDITDEYISLRGITDYHYNQLPGNAAVAAIYQKEVSPFDSTVVWQILEKEGRYYLYQPARKAYVTRTGRDYKFTDDETPLDIIRDNGDGSFGFHAGGGYSDGSQNFACICTNEPQIPVRNWTWGDHGSKMQIIENPNISVDDILTAIDQVPAERPKTGDGVIYNLSGQRLNALPRKGVVIVDRKKIVVR